MQICFKSLLEKKKPNKAQEIRKGHKHFHYPERITVIYFKKKTHKKLALELLDVDLYTLAMWTQNYQIFLWRGLTKLFQSGVE